MREMILNHASVCAPESDRESVTRWLKDLAVGMAGLVRDRIVQNSLRMAHGPSNTPCLPGYSLFDALQKLRVQNHRDAYGFLVRLAARIPLLSEVSEDVRDRFRACEERTLTPPDGEPLVFCAITDGITVGFPSASEWDRDRITVHFDELLPEATIERASEQIDQLTRAEHAGPICARHRDRLLAGSSPAELWANRKAVFPHLSFGPGVERNLRDCAGQFSTIAGKLSALDAVARDWQDRGGSAPDWNTLVSPEGESVRNNPVLRKARVFASRHGTEELFAWHARFGSSGRIHLRFDPKTLEVEIGYIGPHLPL